VSLRPFVRPSRWSSEFDTMLISIIVREPRLCDMGRIMKMMCALPLASFRLSKL